MKISMTSPILGRDGKPLLVTVRLPNGEVAADPSGAVMTLGRVCINAAEAVLQSDERKSVIEKYQLGVLGDKCDKDEADLTAEEIALLKERIGHCYGPYVIRRAHDLLDPPTKAAAAPAA